MAFTVTSAKLTTTPSHTSWVQVHDFSPEDSEKLAKRGRLTALFCLETKDLAGGSIDSMTFGRQLLARFHEVYYGDLKKKPFEALEDAVKLVAKEFTSEKVVLTIGASAFWENALYVCTLGTKAFILRSGNLVQILGADKKVLSASGHPQAGDIFLMGSEPFFAVLSTGRIKGVFAEGNIESAMQKLLPAIHSLEKSDKVGAFALSFQGEKEPAAFVPHLEEKVKNTPPLQKLPEKSRLRLGLAGFVGGVARFFPEKKIRVHQETGDLESEKRKRVAATAGTILLVILLVSIVFGIKQKRVRDEKSAFAPRLEAARYELEEAKSLAGLNPGRARELVLGAKTKVLSIQEEGVEDAEVASLRAEIEANLGELAGIYEPEFETFDLSLISSGFKGSNLSLSEGEMLVLDRESEKLVSMKIATKKTQVVASSDVIDKPLVPANYAGKNYLLTEKGVYEVEDGASELVAEKDWESEFLAVYAGNLYILDKGASIIWRYPAIEEGFAAKQNWFGPGVTPDLENTISWSIDGSVWLLSAGGRVAKFTLGKQDAFSPKGLDIPLASATALYTNEENQYLYLLDAANSRVVVLDKKGEFKAEYLSAKIKEAIAMVASEKTGQLILLTGEKLYFGDLEHL